VIANPIHPRRTDHDDWQRWGSRLAAHSFHQFCAGSNESADDSTRTDGARACADQRRGQ